MEEASDLLGAAPTEVREMLACPQIIRIWFGIGGAGEGDTQRARGGGGSQAWGLDPTGPAVWI